MSGDGDVAAKWNKTHFYDQYSVVNFQNVIEIPTFPIFWILTKIWPQNTIFSSEIPLHVFCFFLKETKLLAIIYFCILLKIAL